MNTFIPFGFRELDALIKGFRRGRVTVIDTAFPIMETVRLLAKAKIKIGIFSDEYTKERLSVELIYQEACTNRLKWKAQNNQNPTNKEYFTDEELSEAYKTIPFDSIFVFKDTSAYKHQFYEKCRELKEDGIEILIFDVWDTIFRKSDNISFFSQVAKELNIAIIALRCYEYHKADVDAVIHWSSPKEIYSVYPSNDIYIGELKVVHNKHGATGTIPLLLIQSRLNYHIDYEINLWFDFPHNPISICNLEITEIKKKHPSPDSNEAGVLIKFIDKIFVYNKQGQIIGIEKSKFNYLKSKNVLKYNPHLKKYKGIEQMAAKNERLLSDSFAFFRNKTIVQYQFISLITYLDNYKALKEMNLTDFFNPTFLFDLFAVLKLFNIEISSSRSFVIKQVVIFLEELEKTAQSKKITIPYDTPGDYFYDVFLNMPLIKMLSPIL